MTKRNYSYLTKREDITEELKLIKGSDTDFITPSGNIYKEVYSDDKRFLLHKKANVNNTNGYVYCGITYKNEDGSHRNVIKRVHRLVAESYIDNPNNYSVVGHKNNIKHDNRVDNLYWTTISENTQKAFDDGLITNDSGFMDSQSNPVGVFDHEKRIIRIYGSHRACSNDLGMSMGTIARRLKDPNKPTRKFKRYDIINVNQKYDDEENL